MEQFLPYLIFDTFGVIILSAILIVLLVQLIFYLNYYKKPVSYYQSSEYLSGGTAEQPSVSVIIIARNESENLANNLPAILNQNYPDYEVVVVNDGSTDESENLLKKLKLEHPHLYSTFSPEPYETISNRQKLLSMTIGIKAATKDILLFIEADTFPLSDNWIASIMSRLTPEKDIVLGYCRYNTQGRFWSKIALFDNLIFTLQYMSMAIKNKPFTGIYRNIAYRKQIFFDMKGFSSSLQYDNAEDIFLNSIMTEHNTAVALSEDSYVSFDLDFSMWRFLKKSYMRAKSHYKNFNPRLFSLETLSAYLFYIFISAGIVYSCLFSLWIYLGGIVLFFLIRFFIQFFVLKKASDHFQTDKFILSLPLMDLIRPLYIWRFGGQTKMKMGKNKKRF